MGSIVVWVLRESFLAYVRFHGVFLNKEGAQANHSGWKPIERALPDHMEDPENDPFRSPEGSESTTTLEKGYKSLWVVEPWTVG